MKKYMLSQSFFLRFFLHVLLYSISFSSYAQVKTINIKDFGAKGDGITNDTKAVNAAILEAASEGVQLVFEKNRTYLVDTVSLSGAKYKPYSRLEIIGNNAIIKCINQNKNNVLNFFFIDTLIVQDLSIYGNKNRKTNGSGMGVYYSKYCSITGCTIQECKFSGILIAWSTFAQINNNLIFNNGDGSLPTDGISIHSLAGGTISSNVIYKNNPLDTQDGDGIQIGSISSVMTGYYDPSKIQRIKVFKNICFQHGRRGIKIQRSKVLAEENFLSENAIGVSIVNGLLAINDIQVRSNFIQKSYKGITTEGGGNYNISNADIERNFLSGSIMTDRILLKDASNIRVSGNVFDRHSIKVYDKKRKLVNYMNINASNARNADSSNNSIADIAKNLSAVNFGSKTVSKEKSQEEMAMTYINAAQTNYTVPNGVINNDSVFGIFINNINWL